MCSLWLNAITLWTSIDYVTIFQTHSSNSCLRCIALRYGSLQNTICAYFHYHTHCKSWILLQLRYHHVEKVQHNGLVLNPARHQRHYMKGNAILQGRPNDMHLPVTHYRHHKTNISPAAHVICKIIEISPLKPKNLQCETSTLQWCNLALAQPGSTEDNRSWIYNCKPPPTQRHQYFLQLHGLVDWVVVLHPTPTTTTQNEHKKTKARFSRLLWHPAWKRRGPIVVSGFSA